MRDAMSWSVPLLLRIVAAYVVGPLFAKPLVDTCPQRTVVLLQFAGCFAVALLLALHQLHVDWRMIAGPGDGAPDLPGELVWRGGGRRAPARADFAGGGHG